MTKLGGFLKKIFKKRSPSLKISLLYSLMVGLVFASLAFFVFRIVSSTVLQSVYLSEDAKKQRELDYANNLQAYADENKISHEDVESLYKWVKGNKYLYVLIYKDDQLLFDSGTYEPPKEEEEKPGVEDSGSEDNEGSTDGELPPDEENKDKEENTGGDFPDVGITIDYPSRDDLLKYAAENDSHLITLVDANVLVSMVDYTEYFYYDIFNITSIVLAMSVLVLVVMLHFRKVTVRILKLAGDVSAVADGDVERRIRQDGSDEIGVLCRNVEEMRSNIVTNLEKERAALDANAELITSMSHDLRTPLTVLLGYIDVMKAHSDDALMTDYLLASENTAMRLKKLSDDLFNYFLVFGGGVGDIKLEKYDGQMLLEQLLAEHVLLLRETGYNVEFALDTPQSQLDDILLITDAPQLMRIVDNLFSNISKYADKSAPVLISIVLNSKKCNLTFTNKIRSDIVSVESNGIGIKTCEKLSTAINADFSVQNSGGIFSASLGIAFEIAAEEEQ